jgi:hypothetical protein
MECISSYHRFKSARGQNPNILMLCQGFRIKEGIRNSNEKI